VDTEAADLALSRAKAMVEATHGPRVLGGIGGFSGLFDLAGLGRDPVLAASADGVGTKLLVAQAMDRHDTVGIDLVAMVVDDLIVVGARPLFLLDYIAIGKVVPAKVEALVRGVAKGCELARCALLGGETAEHPGAMEPGHYDLAGFGVGVAERDRLLGPERVEAGDVLLGLASSGLHSNGYSLVRRAFEQAGIAYTDHVDELGTTLGEALLTPTRIYASDLIDLLEEDVRISAFCHITGGGLPGNIKRSVPPGLIARIDYSSWSPPALFELVRQAGRMADTDLAHALNLGIGMVVVLPGDQVERATGFLAGRGLEPIVIGEVVAG
jgi:phosphoribosylformylglycinamidine cyclo-ligase